MELDSPDPLHLEFKMSDEALMEFKTAESVAWHVSEYDDGRNGGFKTFSEAVRHRTQTQSSILEF